MNVLLIKSYTQKPWRSPETYHLIEECLQERWQVISMIPSSTIALKQQIEKMKTAGKDQFVFNIAEFINENEQTGFIPKLLDDLAVPHLGSTAETIIVGLDKAATKQLLVENKIPTPDYFVQQCGQELQTGQAERIGFPLFVKPLYSGGHIGVSDDSIVHSNLELRKVAQEICQNFHQPALVEAFIDDDSMREFSVGVVGNGPYLFAPVEIDYEAMRLEKRILSFDAAQKDLEVIKPIVELELKDKLCQLALETFQVVGAKDYSRIDLRMDQDDCYVLEINTMPGLGPHSFLPEAMEDQHGMSYSRLIQALVEVALKRT